MPGVYELSGRIAELAPLVMATPGTHAVQLYEDDVFLVEILARVMSEGLERGEAVVTITTARHHEALAERLARDGIDVEPLRDAERYVALDAAETLAALLVDGSVDAERFQATVGAAIDRAASTTLQGKVRAFGELVALLWAEGKREAALALEGLWDAERLRRRGFSLLCAYPLTAFSAADDTPRFAAMCRHHPHVAPAESYTILDSAGARLRAIAELQQKALVLEGETARGVNDAVTITCKRCRCPLLQTSRIGNGEAAVLAEHLQRKHPGVLRDGSALLGEILREMLVGAG